MLEKIKAQLNAGKEVKIEIKVQPNAKENKIIDGEIIKITVTTIPDKGRANEAVISLLAKELRIGKTRLEIIKGQTVRQKTILIK